MGRQNLRVCLPQGTHRTWQANRELTVRAGNAGGVYVAVNNANAKQLGNRAKSRKSPTGQIELIYAEVFLPLERLQGGLIGAYIGNPCIISPDTIL
jgi:hypothetical protein